ncbi:hypothetical protein OSTOST_11644, partial [Ostertagia ostertagi]
MEMSAGVGRNTLPPGPSGDSKTPVYAVERLNKQHLAQKVKRKDKFYEEARLPSGERSTLADYQATYDGRRMDRGHV